MSVNSHVASVTDGHAFQIQPRDIRLAKDFPLGGAFGMCEMEETAAAIVEHCLQAGGWVEFTRDTLVVILPSMVNQDQDGLDNLLGHHWLVMISSRKYAVTDIFIRRCFEHYPAGQAKLKM